MAHPKTSPIAKAVMKKIEHGSIPMRPRAYFAFLTILSVGAIATTALGLAYIFSMLLFWIRIQTADTHAWGARAKLDATINNFPWWSILLAAGLFIAAVWLTKKHGRLYRYKTSLLVLIMFGLSVFIAASLYALGIGNTHKPPNGHPGRYHQ